MKKLLILLGAMAFAFTMVTAEGKCGDSKKEMKCDSGKCNNAEKCSGDKNTTKEVPKKGKCGQGKCG